MKEPPKLIVMLTHHDLTVENAQSVFAACRDSGAEYWGMKEEPLPLDQMKALYSSMKAMGKTTALEVVAYSEEEGLSGARTAAACGCDILMGTTFSEKILSFCRENGMRYMPFVGTVKGRPSVLHGSIDSLIREANRCVTRGVYGIDLLAYRYEGDSDKLIRQFVKEVDAPVCIAGSIDRTSRLDLLNQVCPWGFTIGSAFFEHRFGDTIPQQINRVLDYMQHAVTTQGV